MIMRKLVFAFMACLFLMACGDDDTGDCPDNRAANETTIIEYLDANSIQGAERTSTGLYFTVDQEGNGTFPTVADDIVILYNGYTVDGTVFDQRLNEPIQFALRSLIQGWQEGIPKFSEGGRGKLFIPAHLAYGCGSPSNNGVIIFEIQLLEVR